jgi:hypothetical protein
VELPGITSAASSRHSRAALNCAEKRWRARESAGRAPDRGQSLSSDIPAKHFHFTKICSSLKLTFAFSETKVSLSFPTPSRPSPQLPSIKWKQIIIYPFLPT